MLLLSVALGGLITGTIVGTWVHYTEEDRTVPVAVTGALLSMMLVRKGDGRFGVRLRNGH